MLVAMATPTVFWISTSTTAAPRNSATPTPPFFNSSKLAEKPMVVKNTSSKKARMLSLKMNSKLPVWKPTSVSTENSTPPMIGPGMK